MKVCHDCGETIKHPIDSQTREVGDKEYSWHNRCWRAGRWVETFLLGEEAERIAEENNA